ncbi:hypothetical protein M9Y10_018781 [Tritrichomonas musculus]|uniref:Protein kinase domain-containing protein n=1 Tax=Tritrichomonas musculus TaxID=1915356 RepID=A0ABR2HHP4_9EUKA
MAFMNVSDQFKSIISCILDKTIRNIYSKFNFFVYNFGNNQKSENNNEGKQYQKVNDSLLFDHLKKYSYITYVDFQKSKNLNQNQIEKDNILQNADVLFCVEGECLIVNDINIDINNIIEKLQKQLLTVVDIKTESLMEEIQNFCKNFKEIKSNQFLQKTLPLIAGYLIGRFSCPTFLFKDPSFFNFDEEDTAFEIEFDRKINVLNLLLQGREEFEAKVKEIQEQSGKQVNKIANREFKNQDFIVLRQIYLSSRAIILKVIHLDSLFIFALKKFRHPNIENNKNEIFFCQNYAHRCFTRFYGFLKENGKIEGLVYDYMSNNSVDDYIMSHQEQNVKIFALTIINRIFQGIEYLHSNSLIFRDLKPSNILLDHDFIPYISDFETIRHIGEGDEVKSFTNDIGSYLYASPEQYRGYDLSYACDIYSFGLSVFFLMVKKHYKSLESPSIITENYFYYSKNLQSLIEKCIKENPTERITKEDIKLMLINEFNSFYYLEDFLLDDTVNLIMSPIHQFVIENIIFQKDQIKKFQKFINNIFAFLPVVESKMEKDKGSTLVQLGNFYYEGYIINTDYTKAKYYYELSAQLNNYSAIVNIGVLYLYGKGVKKDQLKGIKYLELAAQQKNKCAFLKLGIVYSEGIGVKKDYIKAKEYFELAAQQNDLDAVYNLGVMHSNGYGVEPNYPKAKEYFEICAKQNYIKSYSKLGFIYYNGLGTEKDYIKAKEYLEKAVEHTNSIGAMYDLGCIYLNGYGIERDYLKAKFYFELAANYYHFQSFFQLGNIYYNGLGVKKDYSKAKYFFELSVSQGNSLILLSVALHYLLGDNEIRDYVKGLRYLELAANKNNPNALYYLGYIYIKEIGVNQDYSKAIKYFEKAANYGIVKALHALGYLYSHGFGVSQDYSIARNYFEKAAEKNCSDSIHSLGFLYLNGYGVEQDYKKAREYFEKSALLNNKNSLLYLAHIYSNGLGIKQDLTKSDELFELFAQKGKPDDLLLLGLIFENGYGVAKDYSKSIKYYQLASQHGNSSAQYNLGNLYEMGKGVEKNYQKAKQYYELAAQQSSPEAIFRLGVFYACGYDVEKDFNIAIEYFKYAATLNNSNAFVNLGVFYYNGYGVEKNVSKAIEYFKLGEKMKNPKASLYLGILYTLGTGVAKDYLKAKFYFEQLSQYNDASALSFLGNFYFFGRGVKQDYLESKKYFELAAKFNDSYSLFALGVIYFYGYGVGRNYSKAKNYFELAGQEKNSEALINLGILYGYGWGVQLDYSKTRKYFELASQLGNFVAHFFLGDLYSNGLVMDVDISKAIDYFLLCIQIDQKDLNYYAYNKYYYRAYNDLGLIYITVYKDVEKAKDYIKEAAFAEYPFGQNNYGLINEFYLNDLEKAEYMYKRSSEHHFALAEFNLARIKERNGKVEESIEYYLRASEDEDLPLMFRNMVSFDNRLEYSKAFIICYTNLKLSKYYLEKSNIEDAKKYFNRSVSKLNIDNENISHPFQFVINNENNENPFSYLKIFILNFPLFNLQKQPNINLSSELFVEKPKVISDASDFKYEIKSNKTHKREFLNENGNYNSDSYCNNGDRMIFKDPNKLFDFVMEDKSLIKQFKDEINDIINTIDKIIYTPPYSFLFGRVILEKSKNKLQRTDKFKKDINELFYEGLGSIF